jgi:hypothetical protein
VPREMYPVNRRYYAGHDMNERDDQEGTIYEKMEGRNARTANK